MPPTTRKTTAKDPAAVARRVAIEQRIRKDSRYPVNGFVDAATQRINYEKLWRFLSTIQLFRNSCAAFQKVALMQIMTMQDGKFTSKNLVEIADHQDALNAGQNAQHNHHIATLADQLGHSNDDITTALSFCCDKPTVSVMLPTTLPFRSLLHDAEPLSREEMLNCTPRPRPMARCRASRTGCASQARVLEPRTTHCSHEQSPQLRVRIQR